MCPRLNKSVLLLIVVTIFNSSSSPTSANDNATSPASEPVPALVKQDSKSNNNGSVNPAPVTVPVNGSSDRPTSTNRDARVLSFIRDLFSSLSSPSGHDSSQRVPAQQQYQQYANYPEVDKYGEYLQSYPVNAQYQIGSNHGQGGLGLASPASSRPGPLSGYYLGTVTSVMNPNYHASASLANPNPNTSPWITNANLNANANYNYNYNNLNSNYAQAQSVFSQLGGSGGGVGGILGPNYVNPNTNTQDQSSSSNYSILKTLMSAIGLSSLTGSGSGTSTTTNTNNFLTSTGEFDPTSLLTRIFDLGSSSMENLVTRMNKFDKLQCIPRLICQTIARRQEDAALAALTSTTTTTTTSTRRPRLLSRSGSDSGNVETDNHNDTDTGNARDGRFIKFQGFDTALQQFVNFLDLMQLKEWSLYPLLNGAYHGSQAARADDCRTKFETCPFSDQQLVYYFNNYNGGFFQSI